MVIENIVVDHGFGYRIEDVYFIREGLSIQRIAAGTGKYYLLGNGRKKTDSNINDMYLVQLDQNGETKWVKSYNSDYSKQIEGNLLFENGEIFVTTSVFAPNADQNDVNVVCTDKDGELIWTKTIEAPNYQVAEDIISTPTAVYCVGRSIDSQLNIKTLVCRYAKNGNTANCNEIDTKYSSNGMAIQKLDSTSLLLLSVQENDNRQKWLSIIGLRNDLSYMWSKKVIEVTGDMPEARMVTDPDKCIYIQSQIGVDKYGYKFYYVNWILLETNFGTSHTV